MTPLRLEGLVMPLLRLLRLDLTGMVGPCLLAQQAP